METNDPKDIVFLPRRNILVVEEQVLDFLYKVVGIEGACVSDESQLYHFHPFDGCETYGELLESGAPIVPPEKFVPYSHWVREVRGKTQEIYGVVFEKDNPYLWEIGFILSRRK